jgi:hypothetical protein
MCDKPCSCCQTVIAYKDIAGGLHSTKEVCDRRNKEIKKIRLDKDIDDIFRIPIQKYADEYRYGYSANGLPVTAAPQILSRDWKQIRDALNKIEE